MMFVFVSIFNIRQFDQSNTNDSSENFKMQFFLWTSKTKRKRASHESDDVVAKLHLATGSGR